MGCSQVQNNHKVKDKVNHNHKIINKPINYNYTKYNISSVDNVR